MRSSLSVIDIAWEQTLTDSIWGLRDFIVLNLCQEHEQRNVNVQSNCEHHFVIIDGLATVAYVPNEKVLGLSKINRIVEYFAKRPQIQERLTEQVFHALCFILETDNVAVMIDAQHYCVKSRGVEDTGSSTVTTKLGGGFKTDPAARAEFLSIARMGKC